MSEYFGDAVYAPSSAASGGNCPLCPLSYATASTTIEHSTGFGRQTDRQTDRQTELVKQYGALHASAC